MKHVTEKTCKVCGITKPIEQYYKNYKYTRDGHILECKPCYNNTNRVKYHKKMQNTVWVIKERLRNRLRNKPTHPVTPQSRKKYAEKYPEKILANLAISNDPKVMGHQFHHWSYNEEHRRDTILLSIKHHRKAHRFLIYDQSVMMFRTHDTMELLDSKEKHIQYINTIIQNESD